MCCGEDLLVRCIISMVIRRQMTLLMTKLNYACEYLVGTIAPIARGGLEWPEMFLQIYL